MGGTFTIDLCAGKTDAEIRDAYRRINRAAGMYQRIAMALANRAPGALEQLPQEWRDRIKNDIAALAD